MARPENVRCVLFDCDGVIVDSEPVAARRNALVYQSIGVPATYEDCLTLCGKSGEEIPRLAARLGHEITLGEFRAATERAKEEGLIEETSYLDPGLSLMPGVRDLLVRLRARGTLTGLVSTTQASHILVMLDRFGLAPMFDAIVTGDMVRRRKPDPEPYLTALRYLGVEPGGAVVVEDSPTGIAAGRAAGAYVLGFGGSPSVTQDVSGASEPLASFSDLGWL